MSNYTAAEVAEWMVSEIDQNTLLYQQVAVDEIAGRFGEEFTYTNANGNLAIGKGVLAEFKQATGDTVIWNRSGRYWRKREDNDEPGRLQG
jgi:hypothetical protein